MRIQFKYLIVMLIILGLLTFSSCKKQKTGWQGTIEEENGVTVIKNPKEPMYCEDVFSLEEELSIGEKKGQEEYMFSQLTSIDVDEDENIYVFDLGQAKIKAFDKNGNFLRKIGRKGQGPGEFTFPWGIIISPTQELVVCDLMSRRLIFFSLDGKYQRDIPTWRQGRLLNMMLDSRGEIIGEAYISGEERIFTLKKFNSNFELLFTIKSIGRDKIPQLESLSPKLQWCISDSDEIIWGYSSKYELNTYNPDGKLVKKIIKDHEPVQINEEEYSEQIKIKFGGRPIPSEFEQELPTHYPSFESISVDEKGRLYIGTFQKTDDGMSNYYDVFNSEGKYIAKIPLKFKPQAWKKNKLYTIEEDEEGFQMVKRYEVTWKVK